MAANAGRTVVDIQWCHWGMGCLGGDFVKSYYIMILPGSLEEAASSSLCSADTKTRRRLQQWLLDLAAAPLLL